MQVQFHHINTKVGGKGHSFDMIQSIRQNTQEYHAQCWGLKGLFLNSGTRPRCWLSPLLQYGTGNSTQSNEEKHKRHPHMKGESKTISIHRHRWQHLTYMFPKNQQKNYLS